MCRKIIVAISTIFLITILFGSIYTALAETNLSTILSNNTRETDLVPVTRWVGPGSPTLFNETKVPSAPFTMHQVFPTITPHFETTLRSIDSLDSLKQIPKPVDHKLYPPSTSGKVDVLVDSTIYGDMINALAQYESDVEKSGFSVEIYSINGGTPEDIRSFLQGELSCGLVGALLVGDIPVAWYEIDNDFGSYTNFPMDLFYMDLDGTWTDSEPNGIYDGHTGQIAPEIWIGRLYASPLTGSEVTLLQNYFDKNHKYRTGLLSLPDRALVYIDDDWYYPWADYWSNNVGLRYNDRTLIKDKSTTVATDYKVRLTQNYEHILLAAHSSYSLHSFKINDNWGGGDVWYSDIQSIDPQALFYNLFACSNARYIETNYMAGHYIFADTYGLAAVGSTKTGSMLGFQYFYDPLSQNKNLGEAFKEWFTYQGITDQSWHYGMVLLGDPTLTTKIKDVSISSPNINCYPFIGKPITISATVHNTGDTQLSSIIVQFYNEDPEFGGSQIGSDMIIDLINADENKTVSTIWDTSWGSYDLYVVIDPYDSIIEIDETNNRAHQIITIQEPTNTILLVDDDYFYDLYSYESYYKNALVSGNYSYDIWHVSALGSSPNATVLTSYPIVIWFTGRDWETTLTPTDQANLQGYLNSGGNLFITGQDIGFDIYTTSFYSDYLHAQYLQDDTNIFELSGMTGDPIGDELVINITGGEGANNQFYQSEILPNDTYASMVFNYSGDGCGAIKADTGTYRVVYFAFGFEAINNSSDRNTVIDRVIKWLDSMAPNVTIISPFNNTYVKGVQHINATVTDLVTGVSYVTANVSNLSWSEVYVLKQDVNVWYNDSWDTTLLADGSYKVAINATDGAGNNNCTEYVNVIIDNTPPIIISAHAHPSLIEANGTDDTLLNVTATDISGIASVTVNLSAIGGSANQAMTNNSGMWKFTTNTTVFGKFYLPVNVTDNVDYSNTSVNITLEAVDTTPPVVTDTSPENLATGVNIDSSITATFNEAINSSTLNNKTMRVYSLSDEKVTGETFEDTNGTWNSSNFQGFKLAEELTVLQTPINNGNRTIDEQNLTYSTYTVLRNYQVYNEKGLEVDGSGNYSVIGWLGDEYAAVNGKPNKLTKIVFEQEANDTKTLHIGETWELGEGYSLTLMDIDVDGEEAWLMLNNSNGFIWDSVISNQTIGYMSDDIANESNVPIFVTYINKINLSDTNPNGNWTQLKYTWLISQDASVINTGQSFGLMEVSSIGINTIKLDNEINVSLSRGNTISLFDVIKFEVEDTSTVRYRLVSKNKTMVEGDISYEESNSIVTFDPDSDLLYNTDYISYITTGVEDIGGNNLLDDHVWEFKTVAYNPPSKSSGGGGGGGGGTSGEDFYNIVLSETDRQSVFKNSNVSFRFELEGNVVKNINFIALNSAGTVAAKVEILNNTSTLVSTPPPHEVYKNLNIWVGNYGWSTDKNMAGTTVNFMVEKSWVIDNDIRETTIALYRYSNDNWDRLVTRKTREDSDYLYFEAEVPGFSPFAVAGQKKTVEIISTPTPVTAVGTEVTATEIETPTLPKKPSTIGLAIIIIVLVIIGVFAYLKRDYIIDRINQRRQ